MNWIIACQSVLPECPLSAHRAQGSSLSVNEKSAATERPTDRQTDKQTVCQSVIPVSHYLAEPNRTVPAHMLKMDWSQWSLLISGSDSKTCYHWSGQMSHCCYVIRLTTSSPSFLISWASEVLISVLVSVLRNALGPFNSIGLSHRPS